MQTCLKIFPVWMKFRQSSSISLCTTTLIGPAAGDSRLRSRSRCTVPQNTGYCGALEIQGSEQWEKTHFPKRKLAGLNVSLSGSVFSRKCHAYLLDNCRNFINTNPHDPVSQNFQSFHPAGNYRLRKGLVDIAMVTSPLEIRKPLRVHSWGTILTTFRSEEVPIKQLQAAKCSLKRTCGFFLCFPFLPTPKMNVICGRFSKKTTFGFLYNRL